MTYSIVETCQLRVSKGQPTSSFSTQTSLHRSYPTASEWNHTTQPAAQHSNSVSSFVPETGVDAAEEGLPEEEEGRVLDSSLKFVPRDFVLDIALVFGIL